MIGGRQASRARMEVGVEKKVVRRPSLDSVPKAIHAPGCSVCWGEEVSSVCEYWAEEAGGDAVA